MQREVINRCGCLWNGGLFTSQQLKEVNYMLCGNVSLTSANNTMDAPRIVAFNCFVNTLLDSGSCESECTYPCYERQYASSSSSVSWPDISSQPSLYASYIVNNPRFGNQFEACKSIIGKPFSENISEQLINLDTKGLIRNNFMQLDVFLASSSYTELRDVAAFPLDAMGASLGGTLSLWLGVTVMFAFELFELLYNLVVGWILRNKTYSAESNPV